MRPTLLLNGWGSVRQVFGIDAFGDNNALLVVFCGARKEVEVERLRMAIRDNIVTPEARTHGYGAVDLARLEDAINQIALAYTFKAKPKAEDVFDATFLPSAADRRVN